jgi:endonuclease YncB( thermonuclease family)
MSYTLIKGSFHIFYPDNPLSGPEPDGDTLKFQPDNRALIESLPKAKSPPRFTKKGITTIRFEGIDALETHFPIEGDEYHQRMDLAIAARDILLEMAGFGEVSYWDEKPNKVKTVENHPIRGYVLSNGLDTYGRTIAFVFIGDHPGVDGSRIFVEPEMLDTSLNAKMLESGHAYPAFYLTLPTELRLYLKSISDTAALDGNGVWEDDTASVTRSAEINNSAQLQELVMWPKMFRRFAAFYHDGHTDLSTFDSWLREDPVHRDDLLLFPGRELGNMHDLVKINGNEVKISHSPADIVVVPDDYVLPGNPEIPIHAVSGGDVRIIAALINPKESPERSYETVTIINTTDAEIDLKDWSIADMKGIQKLEGILPRGSVRQLNLNNSITLSNERDTITLLDNHNTIVDQVSYEKKHLPPEGYTMVF